MLSSSLLKDLWMFAVRGDRPMTCSWFSSPIGPSRMHSAGAWSGAVFENPQNVVIGQPGRLGILSVKVTRKK